MILNFSTLNHTTIHEMKLQNMITVYCLNKKFFGVSHAHYVETMKKINIDIIHSKHSPLLGNIWHGHKKIPVFSMQKLLNEPYDWHPEITCIVYQWANHFFALHVDMFFGHMLHNLNQLAIVPYPIYENFDGFITHYFPGKSDVFIHNVPKLFAEYNYVSIKMNQNMIES